MIYLVRTVTSPDVLWSFQSDITADVIRGWVSFLKVFPISNRGVLKTPVGWWLVSRFCRTGDSSMECGVQQSSSVDPKRFMPENWGVSQSLWLVKLPLFLSRWPFQPCPVPFSPRRNRRNFWKKSRNSKRRCWWDEVSTGDEESQAISHSMIPSGELWRPPGRTSPGAQENRRVGPVETGVGGPGSLLVRTWEQILIYNVYSLKCFKQNCIVYSLWFIMFIVYSL